jgi:lysine 2,3-aminomutase
VFERCILNDWEDWRWQLRNRITTIEQLKNLIELTPEEQAGVLLAGRRLALGITPYFFN